MPVLERATARMLFGLVIGGVTAAAVFLAVAPSDAEPVVVAATPVPAPVVTPPAPVVDPTPTRAAAPTATPRHTRTSTPTSRPNRTTSCAEAAMQAGRFDPSCSEYQGYLDPGTAAGREPTSGETQAEYACEQGLIPRSQCG